MSPRLARQDGFAVVTAMIVMALMLTFGLATYALVDTQTRQSGIERQRESSFNLSEGGLQQQGYVLGHNWPSEAGRAYPVCTFTTTAASTPPGRCPQPPNLADATGTGSFAQADYSSGVTWTTRVLDNVGGDAYTDAVEASSTARWDDNRDNKLWVRASATVQGRTRTLVALLKRERLTEPFPRNAVTAGSFATTNNGNKVFINATGSQIVVRCPSTASGCTDYQASKGQVQPPNAIVHQPATPPAMSAAQIERFRLAAQSSSPPAYFTSCPSSLTGAIVFIDLPANTSGCSYNNVTGNSASSPGIVVMPRGTLSFKGTFYGLLYLANQQNAASTVLALAAGSEVIGGVAIDGPGRLEVGSSSGNSATITYAPAAFDSLTTFGTAGLVQNTWRELAPRP